MLLILQKLRLITLFLFIACPQLGLAQLTVDSFLRGNANPTNQTSITWNIGFSEPVNGVTIGNFNLSPTGTAGGSIDNVVTLDNQLWQITVNSVTGQGTLGLDLSIPSGISAISDSSLTLQAPETGPVYTVDRIRPQPVSIAPTDSSIECTSTLSFNVVFSEPVQGLSPLNFSINTNAPFNATINPTMPSVDGTTWTVTVDVQSGEGQLSLDLSDVNGIRDLANNAMLFQIYGTEFYNVNVTPPQIISINRVSDSPTSASSVKYSVVFHEPPTGVTPASFTIDPASPVTGNIASVTPNDDGTSWLIVIDNISNSEGLMPLAVADNSGITDPCGNETPAQVLGQPYYIDRVNPAISSITLIDPQVTPGPTVSYNVQFREWVTTLTLESISLAATRNTTGTISSITTTDNISFVVTLNVSGAGTINLTVNDDLRIVDIVGHRLVNMPRSAAHYTICLTTFGTPALVAPSLGSTIRSTYSLLEWTSPQPTEPIEVYLDDQLLTTTIATTAPLSTPIPAGYHTWYVKYLDSCTSGTVWNFTVLDPAVILFPQDGYSACQSPEFVIWKPVEAATTYTLYLDGSVTTVTTQTSAPLSPPPGIGPHTIRVTAESETGFVSTTLHHFTVTTDDTFNAIYYRSDGQINSIVQGESLRIIGGKFNNVYDSATNTWIPAKNLIAFASDTGAYVPFTESNEEITKLLLDGTSLYAAGNFTKTKFQATEIDTVRLAKIDLTTKLPSAVVHLNGKVHSLAKSDSKLYIGGAFTKLNTISDGPNFNFATNSTVVSNLVSIDTAAAYSIVSRPTVNSTVHDLLTDDSRLYVAGAFTQINNAGRKGLAAFDLSGNLLALEFGIDHYVYSIIKPDDILYVAGNFTKADSNKTRNNLASFDMSTGTPVLTDWAPSTNSSVQRIVYHLGTIYLGGVFSTVNGVPSANFAGVSGFGIGSLTTCSAAANNSINTILTIGNDIIIGGLATGPQ